jgi:hypothetical protein
MDLVDIFHGSFSLIFVIISLVIGFTIFSKYFKLKNRLFFLVGITWIFLSFPWLPDSISFLMNLFVQIYLPDEWYFIIGNVFIPVALISWIIAYTDMINKKKQKLYLGLILIFSSIFEILFFTLLFTDITLIGVMTTPFSADFGVFLTIFLLITTLIMLITGIIFTNQSIRSETKEIRLKGKFLRAAFIIFAITSLLEKTARSIMLGIVFPDPTNPLLLIMLAIVRIFLVISAIAFYGGFLLPRWMKEIFLRDK